MGLVSAFLTSRQPQGHHLILESTDRIYTCLGNVTVEKSDGSGSITLNDYLKRYRRVSLVQTGTNIQSLDDVIELLKTDYDGVVDIVFYDTLFKKRKDSDLVTPLFTLPR